MEYPQMATMPRRARLRRVVRVCCSFMRNLAYYRAGHGENGEPLLACAHPNASFWRQANANFIDVCVLDWCKLLGDKKGEHYWARVVSDTAKFEANLLAYLRMDASAFRQEIEAMRRHRDKFVAHLDSDLVMDIPNLDIAQSSLRFYHGAVVAEAKAGDLAGLADTAEKLERGYQQCTSEATELYRRNI